MSQDLNTQGIPNMPHMSGDGSIPPMQGMGLPVGVPPQGDNGSGLQMSTLPGMQQGTIPQMSQQGVDGSSSSKYATDASDMGNHQQRMLDLQKEFDRFLVDDSDDLEPVGGGQVATVAQTATDVKPQTENDHSYLDALKANFSVPSEQPVQVEDEDPFEEKKPDKMQIQQAILEQMIQANSQKPASEEEAIHQEAMKELLMQQQEMLLEKIKQEEAQKVVEEQELAPWLFVEEEKVEEKAEEKKEAEAVKVEEVSGPQFVGKASDFREDTTVVSGTMMYNDMGYGQINDSEVDFDKAVEMMEKGNKDKPKKKQQAPKTLKNKASEKDRRSDMKVSKSPQKQKEHEQEQQKQQEQKEQPQEQRKQQQRPQKVLRRKMAKTGTILDKYYINIATPFLKEISPARKIPIVLVFVVIVGLFINYGILTKISAEQALLAEISSLNNEISKYKSGLDDLAAAESEIELYDDAALTDEEKTQLDIMDRIGVFETELMNISVIPSISISGDSISTSLSGLTWPRTKELLDKVRQNKYVVFAEVGELRPMMDPEVEGKPLIDAATGEPLVETSITVNYIRKTPSVEQAPAATQATETVTQ